MSHGGDIYRNKVNIDFSVNLSPLPLPEASANVINTAMHKGLRDSSKYPDPEQTSVRRALTALDNVDFDCIYAGSGASELIMACVRAVNPTTVLLALPCYTGYIHVIDSLSCHGTDHRISGSGGKSPQITKYFLKKENGFRLTEDILEYMTRDTDIMFLTDPWNPTGLNIPDVLLTAILDRAEENDIWVLLDQSFLPLSDKAEEPEAFSTAELINRYSRLFIIRSYTKLFSLPGIRMGYMLSSKDNISIIRKQLPEWNLSSVAASAMTACAETAKNTSYITDNTVMIKKERKYLSSELKRLGFTVYNSNTAFILLNAEYDLYSSLLEHGILIRDCSDCEGLGKGFYRVAVKDHTSNALLINTIQSCL